VNEAIERGRRPDDDDATFVCECGRIGCTQKLRLRRSEYEAVRDSFNRFIVVPGHEIPDVDEVIARADGCLVARKQGQEAIEVVRRSDVSP
jgi:hypothetical protein